MKGKAETAPRPPNKAGRGRPQERNGEWWKGWEGEKQGEVDYVYTTFPSPTNFYRSSTWNIMSIPHDFKGWLPTMLSLVDITNYDEYRASCLAHGVPCGYIMSIGTYARNLGFLKMAVSKYPDLPLEDAYWKFQNRSEVRAEKEEEAKAEMQNREVFWKKKKDYE